MRPCSRSRMRVWTSDGRVTSAAHALVAGLSAMVCRYFPRSPTACGLSMRSRCRRPSTRPGCERHLLEVFDIEIGAGSVPWQVRSCGSCHGGGATAQALLCPCRVRTRTQGQGFSADGWCWHWVRRSTRSRLSARRSVGADSSHAQEASRPVADVELLDRTTPPVLGAVHEPPSPE